MEKENSQTGVIATLVEEEGLAIFFSLIE